MSRALNPGYFTGAYSIDREEFCQLKGMCSTCGNSRILTCAIAGLPEFARNAELERLHPHALADFMTKISKLPADFYEQMRRIICVGIVNKEYPGYYSDDFVTSVIRKGLPNRLGGGGNVMSTLLSALPSHDNDKEGDVDIKAEVNRRLEVHSANDLMMHIGQYVGLHQVVESASQEALSIAYKYLSTAVAKAFGVLMPLALRRQQDISFDLLDRELAALRDKEDMDSAKLFIQQINSMPFERKR
jgi:hypothetical protein